MANDVSQRVVSCRDGRPLDGAHRGHVFNNRSWFGELMHWREDYGIAGKLSETLRV